MNSESSQKGFSAMISIMIFSKSDVKLKMIPPFHLIIRTMVPFAKSSLNNGLQLVIDTETYDYTVSSRESEGLIMSLGHHVRNY